MKLTLKQGTSLVFSVVIVAALSGRMIHAWADEAPDAVTQQLEDQVRDRQPKITDVKQAIADEESRHQIEMDKLTAELDGYKNSNAFDVGRMNERGWTYDWEKNRAVRSEGFPQR